MPQDNSYLTPNQSISVSIDELLSRSEIICEDIYLRTIVRDMYNNGVQFNNSLSNDDIQNMINEYAFNHDTTSRDDIKSLSKILLLD